MNLLKTSLWVVAAVALLAAATSLAAEDSRTFQGEISDSQCALNIHSLTRSHQEMLKSKSMGGTPAECSLYCIQHMGGHLVLSAKKDVYHLDNQELATGFVGQKVKLTGILDSRTHTIHVLKIDPQ